MSIQRLPSGRWRAQVYDPATQGNVSVSKVLGGPGTFRTKTEAKTSREDARKLLSRGRSGVTLAEFRERWISDPLYARPKDSTNIHNAERTKAFAEKYGTLPLDRITDEVVAEWIAGGRNLGSIPALRAMFNDAASAKAGRLVESNPFAGLGIARGDGNRYRQPPPEKQVWAIIEHARKLASPSFAAWLQVAAFSGPRPGELDALRWDRIDLENGRVRIAEQWNAKTRTFTLPKNGRERWAPLPGPSRDALLALPRDGDFCFRPLRGEHFTPSARAYHWKAVRAAAGWDGPLYLATRHFAGWYMVNVLDLDSEDVAIALGHEDGGQLVRRLYGHRDRDRAIERVNEAHERTANVRPLRAVKSEAS